MRLSAHARELKVLLSRHLSDVGAAYCFLLFVLALITLTPLLYVGFTTNDDANNAIDLVFGNVWEMTRAVSVNQGRINFFWNAPLASVPYLVDNRVWYLVVKIGSIFLLLGAIYFAVFQLLKSSWIAFLSLVIFLAFVQYGWEHNALTSYPFVFNFFAVMFLISLSLFSIAIDRKSLTLAALSGVIYFVALGVELFVPFFLFYVAVLLSKTALGKSAMDRLVSGKKYIFAVLFSLIAYLIMYMAWRHIYPSHYDGNNFDAPNILGAANVVAAYSLNAFPLASLEFVFFRDDEGLREILSSLTATDYIKPAVVGFLFVGLMATRHCILPQARTLVIAAIVAFVGIFLPNILLGFTGKHQLWFSLGNYSYLYTYYSFISATVFVALILAIIKVRSISWHPKLTGVLILIGTAVIVAVCFAVEVRNQYIVFDQKLSHRKWQLMDEVVTSAPFMDIPNGAIVLAPTLSMHQRGIAAAPAFYWTKYVKFKTGKNIQFVDTGCESALPCYSLIFQQALLADNQYVVLAKIKDTISLSASDLTIYSMPHQPAVIVGSFIPARELPKLEIDGVPVTNIGAGLFSSNIPGSAGGGGVYAISLKGNVAIIPERIILSQYSIEPQLRTLSTELADGIDFKKQGYPDFIAEVFGMSGYESWGRWTEGPRVEFRFKKALPRKFNLGITATAFGPNYGMPVKVRVGKVEKTFVISPGASTFQLSFQTDGAADTLEIIPPKPTSPNEIDANNGDRRKLGVGFIELKIKS